MTLQVGLSGPQALAPSNNVDPAPRLAVLRDFPEEGWPSMDLFAEMLLTQVGAADLCPPFRRRFTRIPWLGRRHRPSTPTACSTACGTTHAACAGGRPNSTCSTSATTATPSWSTRCPRGGRGSTATTWIRSAACWGRRRAAAALVPGGGPARPAWPAKGGAGLLQHRLGARSDRGLRPDRPGTPGPRTSRSFAGIHASPGRAETRRSRSPHGRAAVSSPRRQLHPAQADRRAAVRVRPSAGAVPRPRSRPGRRPVDRAPTGPVTRLGIGRALPGAGGLSRSNLAALYRAAAVVVQPSEAEGFGLPLAEALACGAAVVASDLPVLREVGGPAAVYCPVADIDGWAAAVSESIARPESAPPRATRLAQARRYSWTTHADVLLSAYRRLLQADDPGRRRLKGG